MGDSVAGGSIAGSFMSLNDAKSHSNSLTSSKGTKKAKKRRVVKTDEQLEEEKRMYFELPRKYCEQIAPSMLRLKQKPKKDQTRVLHVLKKFLKRARIAKVNKQLEHISDFDRSESIIPHGEVSKRLYTDIFKLRDFDLYGRQVPKKQFSLEQINQMKEIADNLDIEYTRVQEKVAEAVYVPDIFENILGNLTQPILTTAKWKVGFEEHHNAPVGLARNPAEPFRSQGNEAFFAYDGEWLKGKMEGWGKYLYDDTGTYEGQFINNWPEGDGTARYPCGDSYSGQWRRGRYEGLGVFTSAGGSVYTGMHRFGRRSGQGKVEFPSGLVYEGDWKDGKPHGRGIMTSKSTKYVYEGEFVKGSIRGTGTLITPDKERVVRLWKEEGVGGELTLPGAVRIYLNEKEEIARKVQFEDDRLYGAMRGVQMKDYVNTVRAHIHNTRTVEKKRRQMEAAAALKEQQAKLKEARLKALAGEEDEDDDEEVARAASGAADQGKSEW